VRLAGGIGQWYQSVRQAAQLCQFYRGFLGSPSYPLGSANDFNNLLTAHQERKTVCLFFVYYQLRESIISSENKSEVVGITAPLHSSVC
jgi:hypothetical protein